MALLRVLADEDECSFDQHGGCQAHGRLELHGQPCPDGEAWKLIEAVGYQLAEPERCVPVERLWELAGKWRERAGGPVPEHQFALAIGDIEKLAAEYTEREPA